MKERIVKFNSPFTFKDGLETAKQEKITLDEVWYNSQLAFETDKAAVSLTDAMAEYHDAILNDGIEGKYAYNGFTILDANIRRPLFNSFAFKHVPHIYGGGAAETDKGFYHKHQAGKGRLASGNNSKITLVDYDSETLEAPIVPITLGLAIGMVDKIKYDHIGFDIVEAYQTAVNISYQIELEKFAFVGHKGTGINNDAAKGLLNFTSDDAVITNLDTDPRFAGLSSKELQKMNTLDLITVFETEYLADCAEKVYASWALINKILLFPNLLASLSKPAHITSSGTVYRSQLEYLKQALNELSSGFGGPEITIDSVPYTNPLADLGQFDPILNEPGSNSTGRVVMYRQDPYIIRSRIAMDLTPGALVLDITNNQLRRNYIAFIGTPLLFYPKHIRYIDNGTEPVTEPEPENSET